MSTDTPIFPHTMIDRQGYTHLCCNACGKVVSSPFIPLPHEMGDTLVVRAWVECPECMEKRL